MTTKLTKTYLLAALILGLFILTPFVAHGQSGNLVVDFETDPLFGESDVKPGDTVEKDVTVTNNSPEEQTVITEAINVTDPDNFGDGMTLTIENSDTDAALWSGSFTDFFDGGEIELAQIAADGGVLHLTFIASFPESAGNEYQTLSMGFDLLVGFAGGETTGGGGEESINNDGGNGGGDGSGGGGNGPPNLSEGLRISNEAVIEIVPPAGTALVVWDTNYPATSQVIYGLTSGGPYSINLTQPNFGYPNATVEDQTKVTSHSVLLTGLIVGETYSYRVVSHASPATVSFEHTFTVVEGGGTVTFGGPTSGGGPIAQSGGTAPSGGAGSGTSGGDSAVSGGIVPTDRGTEEGGDAQAAAAFLGLPEGLFTISVWCLVSALIILLILFALARWWDKREASQGVSMKRRVWGQMLIYGAGIVAAVVVSALVDYLCVILPLIAALILIELWYVYRLRQENKKGNAYQNQSGGGSQGGVAGGNPQGNIQNQGQGEGTA